MKVLLGLILGVTMGISGINTFNFLEEYILSKKANEKNVRRKFLLKQLPLVALMIIVVIIFVVI